MGVNAEGYWQPDLMPKQCEVMNSRKKFLLVTGPVRSGKTVACAHRLLRHAWETQHARIAIFAKTIKSAYAGGVWSDLVETVLPEWLNAKMGMRITKGPGIDGSTRLRYLWLSNRYGGNSEIQLRSLDFDLDVEPALKSGRFSMFWFSELSNFHDRIVFDASAERLRMPHLSDSAHCWQADTNPPDEGTSSPWYKLFYEERLAENHPYPDVQQKFGVVEFQLSDNLFLTESERNEIFARYAHDADRRDRYCFGKWTTSTEAGLFSEVFLADTHVLGKANTYDEDDWEVILPSETCSKMVTGWDIGTSKNHSAHILERIGGDGFAGSIFHVLDEIVSVGTMLTVEDFTTLVDERIVFWEKYIREHCHQQPVEWRHWADTSAFDTFRASLGCFDHMIVAVASEGRIMLQACPKGKGSIFKRVDLLRKLLFQNRIYVSARCIQTVKMLGSLKKGKTKMEPVQSNEMTHVFDSLTYALAPELINELADSWNPHVGSAISRMVSVKL